MFLFEVFAFDVSLKLPLGLIHWNHSKLFPFPPSSFLSCKHMPRNLLGRQREWFGLLWTFTVLLLPHLRVPVTDSSSVNLKILRVSGAGSNPECSWPQLLIPALLIPGPLHVPPSPTQGPTKLWCYLTELLLTLAYLVLQDEEFDEEDGGDDRASSLSAIQTLVVGISQLSGCLWGATGIVRDVSLTVLLLCFLYPCLSPWPLHPFPFLFFGCAHNYFSSLTLFLPACSQSRSTQWPGSLSHGQVKRNWVKCKTFCDVNVYLCCWYIIYNKLWKIMTQQRPQKYMKTSVPVSAVPG